MPDVAVEVAIGREEARKMAGRTSIRRPLLLARYAAVAVLGIAQIAVSTMIYLDVWPW